MAVDAWVPLFAKLIWPAVIVTVGGIYHEEAGRLIGNLNGAIESGRSVKVVDIFEVGAGTPIGEVVKASATDASADVDLSGVQSFDSVAEKGSSSALEQLQEKLRQSEGQTIEVLTLRDNSMYSIDLLHRYIETLGIRYVVFQSDGRFSAWMDAGLFNSQLPPAGQDLWWESDKLFGQLVGVHHQSVPVTASALDTLRIMEQGKVDSIAVLDGETFKSIVTREAILSKLLTTTLLKSGQEA